MDYAIGDVQGCFKSLMALLNKINFNIDRDRLYFLGDVVNRGNNSLETLSLIKSNQDNMDMVLGNHDFHLLVCALTERMPNKNDTFLDILSSPDKTSLLDYLLTRPLILKHKNALLVHAGIPPQWDTSDTIKNAELVHQKLQANNPAKFLSKMYSNDPSQYSIELNNKEKCCYTINALMRMRFCKRNGELEFNHKNINNAPIGFKPWFLHSNRILKNSDIFFGHWSSLKNINTNHVYPMDHGCIWGGYLSAIRLNDRVQFSQKSIESN